MKADVVQINGKDHYKVYDIFVEFNIGGASVFLSNLFNGDEELGTTMNKFLNDYWKEVTAEMRPSLSKSIENILRAVTGRVFETYPLEQILPDWAGWCTIEWLPTCLRLNINDGELIFRALKCAWICAQFHLAFS